MTYLKSWSLWIFVLVIAAMAINLKKDLSLESDIIASLIGHDSFHQAVFKSFHSHSDIDKNIYIYSESSFSDIEKETMQAKLQSLGYFPVRFNVNDIKQITPLIMGLSVQEIQNLFRSLSAKQTAAQIVERIALPLGYQSTEGIIQDPLSIMPLVSKFALQRLVTQNQGGVLIYSRQGDLDFDQVQALMSYLQERQGVRFIGHDLFAFDNFKAIKSDIQMVSLVSIILNCLLFWVFCRNLKLVVVLFVGTAISYICGVFVLSLVFPVIYAVVLAFTSTFIGFNNEYLVHFSGIDPEKRHRAILGLGSAIGTTFIGFAVLLFADLELIRQIAVISLAGGGGFIIFMLLIQKHVSNLRFFPVKTKGMSLSTWHLISIYITLGLGVWYTGVPEFKTRVQDFQYQSQGLKDQIPHFERLFAAQSRRHMVAYKLPKNLPDIYALAAKHQGYHPLRSWHAGTLDLKMTEFKNLYHEKIVEVIDELKNLGVFINTSKHIFTNLQQPTVQEYLLAWNIISPFPWLKSVEDQDVIYLRQESSSGGGLAVDPVGFYNDILTHMQRQLMVLFAVSMMIMLLYLWPLQKSFGRILYIFMPLFLCVALLNFACHVFQVDIHIIHVTGFALIMALAIDYASIMISHGYSYYEQSKVLLTGLSTIVTFGSLSLSSHPVMRDLGAVVCIGSVVALCATFAVRFEEGLEADG